jgi:hypothetical protein
MPNRAPRPWSAGRPGSKTALDTRTALPRTGKQLQRAAGPGDQGGAAEVPGRGSPAPSVGPLPGRLAQRRPGRH